LSENVTFLESFNHCKHCNSHTHTLYALLMGVCRFKNRCHLCLRHKYWAHASYGLCIKLIQVTQSRV